MNKDNVSNGVSETEIIEIVACGNNEELEIEIIDIEAYAKQGKKPHKGVRYKIRVDKETYIVHQSEITGQQILELAGKVPITQYRLDMKLHGGATEKIELTAVVDLTKPGVERFMTLPLDQTEG